MRHTRKIGFIPYHFFPRERSGKGFTLIELLTVISIIGLLASIIFTSVNTEIKSAHAARAIAHLRKLDKALEIYYNDNNKYPDSGGNWDGLYTCWGDSSPDWIAGLVPNYILALPRSPNNSDACDGNYMYYSNGKDFKLIWNNAENVAKVIASYPNLADPERSWAFGFYSPGGRDF